MHRSSSGNAKIAKSWSILDASEDEEEKDGNSHTGSRKHGHERDVIECPWERHDDAHDRSDHREDHSAG